MFNDNYRNRLLSTQLEAANLDPYEDDDDKFTKLRHYDKWYSGKKFSTNDFGKNIAGEIEKIHTEAGNNNLSGGSKSQDSLIYVLANGHIVIMTNTDLDSAAETFLTEVLGKVSESKQIAAVAILHKRATNHRYELNYRGNSWDIRNTQYEYVLLAEHDIGVAAYNMFSQWGHRSPGEQTLARLNKYMGRDESDGDWADL